VRTWAIIVAGGLGRRFGREGGKQLAEASGRPLLAITLEAFEAASSIEGVVLVVHPDRVEEYRAACIGPAPPGKVVAVVAGGQTRQRSVAAGLAEVPAGIDAVAVHDGARPLVPVDVIDGAVAVLAADPMLAGVVVGHPVHDTLKIVGDDGVTVVGTQDRSRLWVAQTPQVLRVEALRGALSAAEADGFTGTDDASLVERAGGVVRMVLGPRTNLKVTVPEDLRVVEALLPDVGGTPRHE
jgi:2-C-methyl-D-erythritol 4-phosphate cytidylyltransferase